MNDLTIFMMPLILGIIVFGIVEFGKPDEDVRLSDVKLICEVVEKDTSGDKLYLISECEVEYKFVIERK